MHPHNRNIDLQLPIYCICAEAHILYISTGVEVGLCTGGANTKQEAMKPHKVEITKKPAPTSCIK